MMEAEGQEEKLKKKFTLRKARKGVTSGVLSVRARGVGRACWEREGACSTKAQGSAGPEEQCALPRAHECQVVLEFSGMGKLGQ